MNIINPPVNPMIPRIDETSIALRLNQRIAAEVLQVSNDHVVLALNGMPFVARLTSPFQTSALTPRKTAQFIVRGFSKDTIHLQLLGTQTQPIAQDREGATNFIRSLLEHIGLPANEANLVITYSLLTHGLPITGENINALHDALEGFPGWSEEEAQVAAQVLASGLPVSEGTIALQSTIQPQLSEVIARLQVLLTYLSQQWLPAQLQDLVQNALLNLEGLMVKWAAPTREIAQNLPRTFNQLGRSIENQLLAYRAKQTLGNLPVEGWLLFSQLRKELISQGYRTTAEEIDRLFDALRSAQLQNVPIMMDEGKPSWIGLDLPLAVPRGEMGNQTQIVANHAQVEVNFAADDESGVTIPQITRILVKVDLDSDESIQVDLSLRDDEIGAYVTASSEPLLQCVETELPSLTTELRKLGYQVRKASCLMTHVPTLSSPSPIKKSEALSEIDLEA
jgi:hypothetical protein